MTLAQPAGQSTFHQPYVLSVILVQSKFSALAYFLLTPSLTCFFSLDFLLLLLLSLLTSDSRINVARRTPVTVRLWGHNQVGTAEIYRVSLMPDSGRIRFLIHWKSYKYPHGGFLVPWTHTRGLIYLIYRTRDLELAFSCFQARAGNTGGFQPFTSVRQVEEIPGQEEGCRIAAQRCNNLSWCEWAATVLRRKKNKPGKNRRRVLDEGT